MISSIARVNNGMEFHNHRYKGVNPEEFEAFKEVINKKTDESQSSKSFLKSLSSEELYKIQKAQGLVKKIKVEDLSEEGAYNLLVSDATHLVDFNNDGIVESGEGKMFMFPPPNAPDAVRDGWNEITKGMSAGEKLKAMGSFLSAQLTANFKKMEDGSIVRLDVGDKDYRSAFGTDVESYSQIIDKMIEGYQSNLYGYDSRLRKIIEERVSFLHEFKSLIVNNSLNI